jgi:hypothetical protein
MKTFGLVFTSFLAGLITMTMWVRRMFKTMGEQL